MKFVKILTSAHVAGVLRHPDEGVLHVSDEDAQRLFDNKAAEDVTSDFSGKLAKDMPVEPISDVIVPVGSLPEPAQHQSEVANASTLATPTSDAPAAADATTKE